MPWQDILIFLNTLDTALGVVFLIFSWLGFRIWWRNRAKTEPKSLGAPRVQEETSDATEWPDDGEGV